MDSAREHTAGKVTILHVDTLRHVLTLDSLPSIHCRQEFYGLVSQTHPSPLRLSKALALLALQTIILDNKMSLCHFSSDN